MKKLINKLDWTTPLRSVNIGLHWRIWFCILLLAFVSTCIWHKLYPHTHWFPKLWTGCTTGGFTGTVAGMFWQFCDKERISQTSGHFLKMAILIWGAFAILSVVMMAPQMKSEETMRLKIRSLSPGNLRSVRIKGQGVPNVLVNDEESICQFCLLTSSAELFYPSHELSLEEFQITLTFQDLISWTFDARIPERHTDAISLLFKGTFAWCEIIIPRGHPWLKSALSKANRPLNPIEKSL